MKNTFDGSSVDSTWPMKKICDLEGRAIETSQNQM